MDASFTRQSPPSEHLAHPGPEELEVTIKSHRTYMNLTDAFFKQTFAPPRPRPLNGIPGNSVSARLKVAATKPSPRSSAPSITCGSGATGDTTIKRKPGPKPQLKPRAKNRLSQDRVVVRSPINCKLWAMP